MITLHHIKASGNHYLMLDNRREKRATDEFSRLAQKIAQDFPNMKSFIVLEDSTEEATVKMTTFHRDGTECLLCGNGIRGVAHFLFDENPEKNVHQLIETRHATLHVQKIVDDISDHLYRVEISPMSLLMETLNREVESGTTFIEKRLKDITRKLRFTAIATPTPHLVTFVKETDGLSIAERQLIAEKLTQGNRYFPKGINVSFVKVDEDKLYVDTFETVAGHTFSCGTAMAASGLLYSLLYLREFGELIEVKSAGGTVFVRPRQTPEGQYWVELQGGATLIEHIVYDESD
ncbi:diaminopimelate epimerase [Vagococcus lutrae]|uniref:diaminopimelate epimerase n=1 Tax=Vagococcus lutrae TaxID=81947 RepID=UPI0014447B3E|nr:diaminopimelate epimerase [Vagococcus lutrae]NKZ27949.1 diaminopimelate epimerase [Vagococcus lutrae]